jgi:hypothetical protein
MDVLFDTNSITLEANPSYYDYAHELRMKYNEYEFSMLDGGGQVMNAIYHGFFDYDEETLTLDVESREDIYSEKTMPVGIKHIVKYTVTQEEKKHFDGYGMKVSKFTIKFDKSPFAFNPLVEYNKMNYPLTFYSGMTHVECNVQVERLRSRKTKILEDFSNDLKYYCEPGIETDTIRFLKKLHSQLSEINILETDEVLQQIIDMRKGLFDSKCSFLRHSNYIGCFDGKIVLHNNNGSGFTLVVSNNTVMLYTTKYIEATRQLEFHLGEYMFPANFDAFAKEILSITRETDTDFVLAYDNLQRFRSAICKLFAMRD